MSRFRENAAPTGAGGPTFLGVTKGVDVTGGETVGVTLGLEDWELWQTAQRLSRRTIDERIRIIRQLHVDTKVQPKSVTAIDIVRWFATHDDWSASTTATYSGSLNAWFKWLQIHDQRPDNPMLKVGTPRVPTREPRPISDDAVLRLLQTSMRTKTRVKIHLALLAGLRVHEIAKVRGEDIDFDRNLLWVTGKGGATKSIPLHPRLRELASEMPRAGWWFPMVGAPSEHVHSGSVSDVIGRTMRRAGIRATPHALRHWYATTLLDDGADIRIVQELMRHKSISSTQIYTGVSGERQQDAVSRLNLARGLRPAA